ncbi:MAG: bifunctional (p)ppGpp synthetase/guanosine-3',5'-bis(diphosphate) 3'-pyrophosphohydrolase [Lachnospiraceae bacterium]|nr:bifunctional (p)ppGpp synthetase/guanosine-3',5'-bis(diphosphate) 3'-pyrophosphohydrolase [Lachnospiraceae bacterium]
MTEIETMWKQLEDKLRSTGLPYEYDRIRLAFDTAAKAHGEQRRKTGELYIHHPVEVALILADINLDNESIMAALLHDVVEDTELTIDDIRKLFGEEVTELVDGVTKLGQISYFTYVEQQVENMRKMLIAMAKDARVIIIKLADRLHNMRTIEGLDPQKQRDKAKETMEIFAPLAHRLGIQRVKHELEDRAVHVLDPVGCREIEDALEERSQSRDKILESIRLKLEERLGSSGIKLHIEGRRKSVYSIYRKMFMQGKSLDEIYDIFAYRVIVDTVADCYAILGIVHDEFTPITSRFKDYISTPKPNMYQSIHTTVVGNEGIPFEVQIRTWDMHYTAEYGIAAHWKYKSGEKNSKDLEERLAWVRRLLENQEDDDPEDVMQSLKLDLSLDEVFVFTPKGDVINLPTGSCIIDFAYAIHSGVGNSMVGAKVGGKIVPFDYVLQNGDIVSIITTSAEGHGPSRDWLKIIKTSEARNKIRQWFKKERRDENIEQGRALLEKEMRANLINVPEESKEQFLNGIAQIYKYPDAIELYNAIGYGGISVSRMLPKIKEEFTKQFRDVAEHSHTASARKKVSGGVIIEGLDDCLVKFAKCCNPVPGDDIIGFVTRGYGVSVHRKDCPVINNHIKLNGNERILRATWAASSNERFIASIKILAHDRYALLADITQICAQMHLLLTSVNSRLLKDGAVLTDITLEVESSSHLEQICSRLEKISGVTEIKRA